MRFLVLYKNMRVTQKRIDSGNTRLPSILKYPKHQRPTKSGYRAHPEGIESG